MELCEAKPAKLRFILTEYIFQPWVTPSTQPAEGTKLQGLQVLEKSLTLTKQRYIKKGLLEGNKLQRRLAPFLPRSLAGHQIAQNKKQ